MIKQMERRFTIVAISVVSSVLLILIILVNGISIGGNIIRADSSLERLAVGAPIEPGLPIQVVGEEKPEPIAESEMDFSKLVFKDKRDAFKEENRSFEVIIQSDMELVSTNANEKNMFTDDLAYEMAIEVVGEAREKGFIDDFRYLVIEEENEIKVLFLDYSFEKQSELNFMMASIGVSIIALIVVTGLVLLFLKPVMKPIKESYKKQKQFITDASHELKTPLTVISTDIEILEMENGPSDWTRSVKKQVERLSSLTNELVTLSRLNEEDSGLVKVEINLSDIVNDVIMGFEPAIIAKKKSLETHIEDDIRLKGHHDSMERVLSILLHNALKYSDDNGSINIELIQKSKKVKLKVTNSVDQIEAGPHNEFFERFYRSDASRNSENGGFGIGLAVARTIVEDHRGKIEAISTDEKSLTINITLKI